MPENAAEIAPGHSDDANVSTRSSESGVDLHTHTTASDGSLTPTELVDRAAEAGLSAIAITDHDTLAALPEAYHAARSHDLELVSGVELNVEYPGRFHLLGYLFDPEDAALSGRLKALQEFRATRNERMVQKMQDHGLPVTLNEVRAEAGGDLVGRPHMAMALLKKGVVGSVQEAFDRYLADGAVCDIPKEKISVQEGFNLIRDAGGVPVVAHPLTLGLSFDSLEQQLHQWKTEGLGGLECYYSQHNGEQEAALLGMARRVGVVATGGSDFHGASKPAVFLGKVSRDQAAPYRVLEALREACRQY